MEHTDKTPSPASGSSFSWGAFSEDFWFRHSRRITAVIAVVAVVAAAWFGWTAVRAQRAEADNKKLGDIYLLLHEGNLPAAEQALAGFLAENPSEAARDKANLFLGKILYSGQRYDEAIEAYARVSRGGKRTPLLYSGALHGRAAAHMQLADYGRAADLLEELVKIYGARTGDPEENLAGEDVTDLSPSVPNALWKLALCRRELGQAAQAKAAAERIIRAYPGSREARDAEKLLATL